MTFAVFLLGAPFVLAIALVSLGLSLARRTAGMARKLALLGVALGAPLAVIEAKVAHDAQEHAGTKSDRPVLMAPEGIARHARWNVQLASLGVVLSVVAIAVGRRRLGPTSG